MGWIWNDADYLYALVDFTVDNTFDGGKDYAALHIKTPDGVKEFRVSVNEKQYGEPAFGYTDQVDYEHKTYRFAVPRSAVGRDAKELQVAFSAYGTAALIIPTHYHEILLDTNAATGGDVEVVDASGADTISNINYRITVMASHPNDMILEGAVFKWDPSASDFVQTSNIVGMYPIAVNEGLDGTDAIEWGVDLSALDNLSGSFTGYFHSSQIQFANDYTGPFQYSLNVSVPTLSEWGMIFFALTLMTISVWLIRKRSKSGIFISALVVILIAGIAWAASIVLDGNVGDWAGIDPIVSDVEGDQSADAYEDIRYGFVTNDGNRIYFRVDVTGGGMVIVQPPS